MKTRRILVVDDETAFLLAIRKLLQRPGVLVDTATTAEEAKSLLARREYDGVIADVRLSPDHGAEGLAIARLARSRSATTRVVVITAQGSPELMAKINDLGLDGYFEKPVSIAVLRRALNGAALAAQVSPRSEGRRKS